MSVCGMVCLQNGVLDLRVCLWSGVPLNWCLGTVCLSVEWCVFKMVSDWIGLNWIGLDRIGLD